MHFLSARSEFDPIEESVVWLEALADIDSRHWLRRGVWSHSTLPAMGDVEADLKKEMAQALQAQQLGVLGENYKKTSNVYVLLKRKQTHTEDEIILECGIPKFQL